MKVLPLILMLTLSSILEAKIRSPKDRELVLSKPDSIEFVTKSIVTPKKHKSKITLDNRSPKKLHTHSSPRKLYEKYDPKKYIRRYQTYQKHVSNAKHHILGNKKIALSKNLKDIRMRKELHEKMMHRTKKRPSKFRVNMKEFQKKYPKRHHKMSRHLTKVVGDDAEDMNELHTNEDDDGGNKLESIPLLLVGDYEIVIEKM